MARRVVFVPHGWEDYLYWQATDCKLLKRISTLIDAARRDPFSGIGKPEPLKDNLSGFWSRRIDDCHRLVYEVRDNDFVIVQCRYHYGS